MQRGESREIKTCNFLFVNENRIKLTSGVAEASLTRRMSGALFPGLRYPVASF